MSKVVVHLTNEEEKHAGGKGGYVNLIVEISGEEKAAEQFRCVHTRAKTQSTPRERAAFQIS